MGSVLGLLFDGVITLMLGATIFYAIRLSRHLDDFRATRNDMARAMQDISAHVTRAQSAVEELRQHAGQSAVNLQALITRADEVSQELQLVTQAGDALSARLEGAAARASQRAQEQVAESRPDVYAPLASPLAAPKRPYHSAGDATSGPAFTIQDREFDAEDEGDVEDTDLSSQAERDLAAVLRKRRNQMG